MKKGDRLKVSDPVITERLNTLKGKMTLKQFSKLVGIGQSTLHNYLNGRDIKATMLKKICVATGTSGTWLLGIYGANGETL